jgi:predicted house-cleaning noncanonical NTP pyrophosphatase (MazG superfamily)
MRKFGFNKLVPQGVLEGMRQDGSVPEVRELTEQERYIATLDKLIEEAQEAKVADARHRPGELANLRLAHKMVERASGCLPLDIEVAEQLQAEEKGDFWPPVYIASLIVEDDNRWIAHFEANPDRYPEILE